MISLVPYLAVVNFFIFMLYIIILRHYRWSAADLQRLDAVSRSPIQASLAEGLDGALTIKAYEKNSFFAAQFQKHNNDNSAAMLNFVASRRWLSVRLESMGAVVILFASLFISVFTEQVGTLELRIIKKKQLTDFRMPKPATSSLASHLD